MDAVLELFREIDRHLTEDVSPAGYLSTLTGSRIWEKEFPFIMLSRLKNVPQSPVYHPEGDVLKHTLLVTDLAARCRSCAGEPRAFMWAALLHDIGKAETTRLKKGRLVSYDHDLKGETMVRQFLEVFSDDDAFRFRVSKLTRWHMQALHFSKGGSSPPERMLKEVPARDIALLALCDRLGRGGMTEQTAAGECARVREFAENIGAEIPEDLFDRFL